MKKCCFRFFGCCFFLSMLYLPYTFAQDYTQWELPEGTIARLGKGRINDMQYSPDGTILAVATTIGIWIYDTETYQERALLANNNRGVEKILFNPEGTVLASAERLRGITLWDVASGKIMKTVSNDASFDRIMLFSPDGATLISGSSDHTIRLWDVSTGTLKFILTGHTGEVRSVLFSPDGAILASGSSDGTVLLWDITPKISEP